MTAEIDRDAVSEEFHKAIVNALWDVFDRYEVPDRGIPGEIFNIGLSALLMLLVRMSVRSDISMETVIEHIETAWAHVELEVSGPRLVATGGEG